MFKSAFSGFSVRDMAEAKKFYQDTLGLKVDEDKMGLEIYLPNNGGSVFVYQKDNHEPATFTILNFLVDDIDKAVEDLTAKGITFEQYHNDQMPQDEKGILRGKAAGMGPDIAWFKDPAGNVLAVLAN